MIIKPKQRLPYKMVRKIKSEGTYRRALGILNKMMSRAPKPETRRFYEMQNLSQMIQKYEKHKKVKFNYVKQPDTKPTHPMMIITIGAPACGKSTWVKNLVKTGSHYIYLSSDELRAKFGKGEEDQSVTGKVFAHMKEEAMRLLKNNKHVIIDACNINKKNRAAFIEIAKLCKVSTKAVVFEVPVEELKRRNKARPRVVPEEVIDRMLANYEPPVKWEVSNTEVNVPWPVLKKDSEESSVIKENPPISKEPHIKGEFDEIEYIKYEDHASNECEV